MTADRRCPLAIATGGMLLALAACGSAPSPPPPQGQAERAEVDRLTRIYGACVAAKAKAVPVAGELAGTLAFRLQRECAADRAPLLAQVAKFYRIGHPRDTPARAAAVAEASVLTLEDEIRGEAVITIVQRQNPTKARPSA